MAEQPESKASPRRHTNGGIQPLRWSGSPEEAKAKRQRKQYLLIGAPLFVVGLPPIIYYWVNPNASTWWLVLGYAAAFVGFILLVTTMSIVATAKEKFEEHARQEAMFASLRAKIRSVGADPSMSELLDLNRAEMQRYHQLTIDQADKSYTHSRVAMYVGLGVLVCCIGLIALPLTNEVSKLSVAALGSISTIVTGYIVKTFLKSHRLSIDQLNNFYNQPLVSSYLLTAERVAQRLPDASRSKTLNIIVEQALRAAGAGHVRSEEEQQNFKFAWPAARGRKHQDPTGTTPNGAHPHDASEVRT